MLCQHRPTSRVIDNPAALPYNLFMKKIFLFSLLFLLLFSCGKPKPEVSPQTASQFEVITAENGTVMAIYGYTLTGEEDARFASVFVSGMKVAYLGSDDADFMAVGISYQSGEVVVYKLKTSVYEDYLKEKITSDEMIDQIEILK